MDYETPSGELTIINYSVDDDEFTLMIDGERRNPTKEFDQKLRENGLIEDIFMIIWINLNRVYRKKVYC